MDGGAWCRLLSTRSQSRTPLSDFTFTFIADSKGREWMIINYADCESASPSHSVVSNSLPPHGLYSPWNSPAQNTVVSSLSLLQGLFPMQGLNPCLPQCTWILYQLSHKGSPKILEWVAYPFSSGSSQARNEPLIVKVFVISQFKRGGAGKMCPCEPIKELDKHVKSTKYAFYVFFSWFPWNLGFIR